MSQREVQLFQFLRYVIVPILGAETRPSSILWARRDSPVERGIAYRTVLLILLAVLFPVLAASLGVLSILPLVLMISYLFALTTGICLKVTGIFRIQAHSRILCNIMIAMYSQLLSRLQNLAAVLVLYRLRVFKTCDFFLPTVDFLMKVFISRNNTMQT